MSDLEDYQTTRRYILQVMNDGSQEAVPIRVELATVRWAKGQEFGVKFLRMQSHEEARLRHVIAELLRVSPGSDA
jgi:hypothetical protein